MCMVLGFDLYFGMAKIVIRNSAPSNLPHLKNTNGGDNFSRNGAIEIYCKSSAPSPISALGNGGRLGRGLTERLRQQTLKQPLQVSINSTQRLPRGLPHPPPHEVPEPLCDERERLDVSTGLDSRPRHHTRNYSDSRTLHEGHTSGCSSDQNTSAHHGHSGAF